MAFAVGWRKLESRPRVQEELHMKVKSSLHRYLAIIGGGAKCLLNIFAICLFAIGARADEYSWTGNGDDCLWTTKENWSGEVVPSDTDIIKPAKDTSLTIDLANGTHTVSKLDFSSAFSTSTLKYPSIELSNGELLLTDGLDDSTDNRNDLDSGVLTENYTCPFNLVNATLKIQTKFKSGCARSKGYLFSVGDGSSLILDHVNLYDKFSWVKVLPGGTADFTFGTTVQKNDDSTSRSTWSNEGGTFSFPAGFTLHRTATAGWSKRASFRLQQKSGVMNLGGDVSLGNASGNQGQAMGLYFQWFGGTVHALSNVTFNVDARYKYSSSEEQKSFIEEDSTVVAEVDADKTMNMSVLELRDGVSLTKTGDGSLNLADVPYSLDIQAGAVTFLSNTRTAMGTLNVGAGCSFTFANPDMTLSTLVDNAGTLAIVARGLTVNSVSANAVLSGTVTVDGTNLYPGDTVIDTPSAALRAQVAAALDVASIPYREDGTVLVVAGAVLEKNFTGAVSSDLADPDNWDCGYVPTDSEVGISGSADFTSTSPSFRKIVVTATGSLSVADGSTLPDVTLQGAAVLTIAADANVTATSADFRGESEGGTLPTIEIGAGATLSVDASEDFVNIIVVNNGGRISRTAVESLAFKWVGEQYASYDDVANWQVGMITGQDSNGFKLYSDFSAATRLPCAGDSFWSRNDIYFNLNGQSRVIDAEIGTWYVPSDWNNHYFGVTNGTFTFRGAVTTHTGTWYLQDGSKTVFVAGSKFNPGSNSGGTLQVQANSGSLLDFKGELEFYNGKFFANDGGRMVFDWSRVTATSGSTQSASEFTVNAGGFMSFPNGIDWYRGGWDNRFTCALNLNAGGEMSLGGNVTKANINAGGITFNVAVTGGKLVIEDDLAIVADSSTISGSVEIDVADGVRFNLSNFDVDATTALTKSGGGILFLDSAVQPASLAVNDGYIGFTTPNTAISLPVTTSFSGGKILVGANGLSIASAPAGVDFAVDVEAITKDAAIVSSLDATLLAKIKSDFEAQLAGQAYEVTIANGAVFISAISPYTFTGTKSTDYSDPENWACGYVPVGQAAVIHGDMEISGEFPEFASLSVERGAIVTVADGIALPAVSLSLTSSLTIVENASVSVGAVTGSAMVSQIPVITVSAGATLTVPAGQKFSNVDLRLLPGSTLKEDGDGSLVFGYAAAGETTYFAMSVVDAKIAVTNSLSPNSNHSPYNGAARIDFASPALGGRVVVPQPVVLKNVDFERDYATAGHYIYDGFAFGLNNPEDETVKIVIDNSFVIFGEHSWIAGGVNLVMTNNAVLCRSIFPNAATLSGSGRNEGDKTDNNFNLHINDLGVLTLIDGGELRTGVGPVNSDVVSGLVSLSPSAAGHVGIEVLKGGVGCWYKMNGSQHKTVYDNQYSSAITHANKGSVSFADGAMDVFKDYWWGYNNRSHLFNGLAGVSVADGTTLTLRGVKDKLATEWAHLEKGIEMESPFTGGGNVVVTNTWAGKTLSLVVTRADNTCSGSISAVDGEGTAVSKIYFANGANWAGTVIANGNAALVDAFDPGTTMDVAVTAPASVTFGSLDLAADFPIRVWKSEGAYSADAVNVGSFIDHGGKLTPVMMSEGEEFAKGDSFVVGKIAKGATLPAVATGWAIKARPIDGDDANDEIVLKSGVGFQIIIR